MLRQQERRRRPRLGRGACRAAGLLLCVLGLASGELVIESVSQTLNLMKPGKMAIDSFFSIKGLSEDPVFSFFLPRRCSVLSGPATIVSKDAAGRETSEISALGNWRLNDITNHEIIMEELRSDADPFGMAQVFPDVCLDGYKVKLQQRKGTSEWKIRVSITLGNHLEANPKTIDVNETPRATFHDYNMMISDLKIENWERTYGVKQSSPDWSDPRIQHLTDTQEAHIYSPKMETSNVQIPHLDGTVAAAYSKIAKILGAPAVTKAVLQSYIPVDQKFIQPIPVIESYNQSVYIGFWSEFAKVEESYSLENYAAKSKSQYDASLLHQQASRIIGTRRLSMAFPPSNTLFHLKMKLPQETINFEYYDRIGNISTTNIVRKNDGVLIDLEPRYPILGGWRADWVISHEAHNQRYAKSTTGENTYTVRIPLAASIREIFIKSATFSVILPPDVGLVEVELPSVYQSSAIVKTFKQKKWLDLFTSRLVVEIKVDNVVGELVSGKDSQGPLEVRLNLHRRPNVLLFMSLPKFGHLAYFPAVVILLVGILCSPIALSAALSCVDQMMSSFKPKVQSKQD